MALTKGKLIELIQSWDSLDDDTRITIGIVMESGDIMTGCPFFVGYCDNTEMILMITAESEEAGKSFIKDNVDNILKNPPN